MKTPVQMYKECLSVAKDIGIRDLGNTHEGGFYLTDQELKEVFFLNGFNIKTKGWKKQIRTWYDLGLAEYNGYLDVVILIEPKGTMRLSLLPECEACERATHLAMRGKAERGVEFAVRGWEM